MRKETKNFRVATLAAPLALAVALTAAFGANAEVVMYLRQFQNSKWCGLRAAQTVVRRLSHTV